jgi:hypothetical protein
MSPERFVKDQSERTFIRLRIRDANVFYRIRSARSAINSRLRSRHLR